MVAFEIKSSFILGGSGRHGCFPAPDQPCFLCLQVRRVHYTGTTSAFGLQQLMFVGDSRGEGSYGKTSRRKAASWLVVENQNGRGAVQRMKENMYIYSTKLRARSRTRRSVVFWSLKWLLKLEMIYFQTEDAFQLKSGTRKHWQWLFVDIRATVFLLIKHKDITFLLEYAGCAL